MAYVRNPLERMRELASHIDAIRFGGREVEDEPAESMAAELIWLGGQVRWWHGGRAEARAMAIAARNWLLTAGPALYPGDSIDRKK